MARKFSRRPNAFEQRIDFEGITRRQTAREKTTLDDLRGILQKMEADTVRWVVSNLAKKQLRAVIPKFRLARQAPYRRTLRLRLTAATKAGVIDVAKEHDFQPPKLRVSDLTRVRARADALHQDHMGRLEADLKRAWAQAVASPPINRDHLTYLTKKVFADFAGWEQPVP